MSQEHARICSCQMSLTGKTNLGGGIFHFRCLEALAEKGVPCLIPLAFHPDHEKRENWDVRALPIRRTFKLGAILSNLVFFFHLCWLWTVDRQRFEILRISDPYFNGLAGILFARLMRLPTLGYIFHIESGQPMINRLIGFVCRRLSAIVVTSEFTKKQVAEKFGIDPAKIHVTYGGITRFNSEKTRGRAKDEFGVAGKKVLAFLGALSNRKNPEGLLDIFSIVAGRCSNAVLILGGAAPKGDDLLEKLKAKSEALGIASRVVFTGWIDNRKKADLYRATDIFVFPSLLEGFGLAVVEAMAEGVPAVVSNRGSLPEVVTDGVNGFVADPDDADAFAESVCKLVEDDSLRRQMGQRAAKDVAEKFTWDQCARQTIDVHDDLLRDHNNLRLAVMLNTGDGVAVMEREGQKDRFAKNYLSRYIAAFDEVTLFSYCDDPEKTFDPAKLVPKKNRMPGLLYSAAIPFLHRRRLRKMKLLRVMQTQGALPAVLSRLFWRVPYVTTYGYLYGDSMRLKKRFTYGTWLDILERIALRLASGVIVTTPSLRRHVARFASENKIHFIPNGVDFSAFKERESISEDNDPLIVLFVGRLEAHKNLDLVIQALAPVKYAKVQLWVVGEGPMKNQWRESCETLGLDAKFFGTIAHCKMPDIYFKSDIFVLPSLFEGHPKALIEAFAAGLPCLGLNAPGIVDVITDGENGLLADETVSSFAGQLVRLLTDHHLRKRLGEAARKHAVENYDLNKLLEKEIEVLLEIAKGKSR